MWKFLSKITKNLVIAIPSFMFLGFLFGLNFKTDLLKFLIVPFTFLMVYPMMINLNIKHLQEGINLRLQGAAQLLNFAVIPFIGYAIGRLFFPDNHFMTLGLLLTSLLPTGGMTISWTGFAKGNIGAAINMTVVGLSLGSIAAPFYVKWLMGTKIDVDLLLVFKQIAVIVFAPMFLGYLTREWLIKRVGQKAFKEVWSPRFPSISSMGVLGIVFMGIALKAQVIFSSPEMLGYILIALVCLYGVNYTVSLTIGRMFFQRSDAVAYVYGTVLRNLPIALAVAINAFGQAGSDAALVISISWIIQAQSAAWSVKLNDRVFGSVSMK
jgi:ACR3 family arsenite efflux pump ArsB